MNAFLNPSSALLKEPIPPEIHLKFWALFTKERGMKKLALRITQSLTLITIVYGY